jgi:predicted metal-dependent enzyme (double-stranded beta helix superfamily)
MEMKENDMDSERRQEVAAVCRAWTEAVQRMQDAADRTAYFCAELPTLARNRAFFERVLEAFLKGGAEFGLRQETLFENELVLYRDPGRRFSLRLYLFGPEEHTIVHDHTSWGVSSSAFGPLEVVRYRREDDGSTPDAARLAPAGRRVLQPGEIETTPPLDLGIHRTGNPGAGVTLMVSVYGSPLRRLYIQRYDLADGSLQRLYPARIRKRMRVEQALESLRRH